ncbi:aKG-HExxH-type peptide beta-hydroxylase [Streptomyces sp. BE303]|uniref:aKG-HExxH-type peptide beta-hydroxylase n=1 Tax=Streptomyces sp. BE303 TaxID=3002528 RepID=UPI002E781495|nr:HEXXH motif-containing putative peptide modification protein [Streptomyces sp. BE303]MED7955383.1 HEXXH motif-containing putative peptide modification protein [Streptomyces sp. BE303]
MGATTGAHAVGGSAGVGGPAPGVPAARGGAGLPRHGVDTETFRALAAARGGTGAVRLLRAGQVSKRALLLLALRRAIPAADGGFAAAYEELAELRGSDRERWEQVLLLPELDAWAADCLRVLAAGGATGGGAPLGVLGEFVRGGPAGEPVPLECDGLRWTPLLDHTGPRRAGYGRPVTGPLGSAELASWGVMLAGAWEILVRRHRTHAEAVAACVTTLVPLLPAPDGSAVSGAARRAHGAVAASLPAEPVLLALALVHEFLHVQLGALMDLVPLHRPNGAAVHHAPWRQDLRPAGALLQGAYAHLGVTDFWRAELAAGAPDRDRAEREHVRWRVHTGAALRTLAGSGELTAAGDAFVAEMARVVRVFE